MAAQQLAQKFKLVFYTPTPALAACKDAVFRAGAGKHPGAGSYTEVAFSSPGVGQFRPGPDAKPAIGAAGADGQPGALEEVGEVRVETLCVGADVVRASVAALKAAHPYETPAYEVYRLEDF